MKRNKAVVTIYSSCGCEDCVEIVTLLDAKGVKYSEADSSSISSDFEGDENLTDSNKPHILINGQLIEGYDGLSYFQKTGELDRMLGL